MERKTKVQWLCVNDGNSLHVDDVDVYPKEKVFRQLDYLMYLSKVVSLQRVQLIMPCQERCTIEVFSSRNWHTKQPRENYSMALC